MLALIILLLINMKIFLDIKPKTTTDVPSEEGEWTVYGSMGCGWTRKQIEYMKEKGKPYTFVDCDKEECAGVDGFPTMIHTNGEKIVGFKEV
jgi:hypothetical protein